MSGPGPALPAVRTVVRRFAAEATANDRRSLRVFRHQHGRGTRRARQRRGPPGRVSWEHIETLLRSALTRAQAQDELAADRDPRGLARMLLVFLQGVRVVGKASGTRAGCATPPNRL